MNGSHRQPPDSAPGGGNQGPRKRRIVLTGIAAVICLAIILRGLQSSARLSADTTSHHSWSYATTGFKALYETLEGLGYRVGRLTRSYGALPDPEDTLLLTLDPNDLSRTFSENVTLAEGHAERIGHWTESGGHVLVTVPGRQVYKWRGVEIVTDDVLDWGTEGDGRRRSFDVVLEGLPPSSSAPAGGRLRGGGPLAGIERDLASLPPQFVRALSPYLTEARGGANAASSRIAVFEEETGGFRSLFSLEEDPFALERPLGDGSVVCVATPLVFSNGALHLDELAQTAIDLIHHASDGGRRRIIFDEYTHDFVQRGGVFRWVRETALAFPLATAVLAIMLLGWYGALRFGPPRPIRDVPRRAKEEFVLSLGELYRRAGHRLFALQLIARGYTAHLDALLGRSPRTRDSGTGGAFHENFEDDLDRTPAHDAALLRSGRELHARYLQDLELVTGKVDDRRGKRSRQATKDVSR